MAHSRYRTYPDDMGIQGWLGDLLLPGIWDAVKKVDQPFLTCVRSSVGLEQVVSTHQVGGSSPSGRA